MGEWRGYLRYNKANRDFARENRKNQTKAEDIVWEKLLRRKQMLGCKFVRQKPLGSFIVDFYCAKLMLAIEIDGSSHDDKEEYDTARTAELNDLGVTVLRFSNDEVMIDWDGVRRGIEGRICEGLELTLP